MDQHTIYILSIIVIIAIFVIVLLGVVFGLSGQGLGQGLVDKFTNIPNTVQGWADTLVPGSLKFSRTRNSLMKGTPLVSITKIKTAREPIELEIPFNWYNTQ